MKLIVGLGNPGKEYEMTRHNSGFCVLDAIAEECCVDITQKKFKALIANTRISGEAVVLMKPQTFMNLSGEAVRAAMDFYKLSAQDLPVGKIRLRAQGSAGGQNGMKNIIRHIGTQEFDRIRVGIGKDARIPVIDWVLGRIRREELEDYRQAVELARDAAIYSCSHSFMDTMSHFNRK